MTEQTKPRKPRFSSHMQLQYLLHKFKLSPNQLYNEMLHYYNDEKTWQLNQTKYGVINGAKLQPQAVRKAISQRMKKISKPKVVVKKRRTFTRG